MFDYQPRWVHVPAALLRNLREMDSILYVAFDVYPSDLRDPLVGQRRKLGTGVDIGVI